MPGPGAQRRRLGATAALLLLAGAAGASASVSVSVCGCGSGSESGRGVAGATTGAATVSSATAPAATTTVPVPADPLTTAVRAEVARTFAPRLRFNAWHDDGNGSRQNRSEDHFPMGVASFLREVESGSVQIVSQGSNRDQAGVVVAQPWVGVLAFGADRLADYPARMAGDRPGDAPVYIHIYEDRAFRQVAANGSGEIVAWAEFWLFYPWDRGDATFLHIALPIGSGGLGSHRGDWEHTSYRVRVRLGAGGAYQGGAIEEAVFYGHGHGQVVLPGELERVDDAGQPGPGATHPVVYVSQGKHASYPEAGDWEGHNGIPTAIVQHADFFRGNGVVVDTWRGSLVDLLDPAASPAELAPPEMAAVLARSPIPSLPDFSHYLGVWGPDAVVIAVPGLPRVPIAESPRGLRGHGEWEDYGGRGAYQLWSQTKAREPRLRCYRDLGIAIPPVTPPPVPVRR